MPNAVYLERPCRDLSATKYAVYLGHPLFYAGALVQRVSPAAASREVEDY